MITRYQWFLFNISSVCILFFLSFGSFCLAGDWQTLYNCQLIANPSNDGDSFHVEVDGKERIFRLYCVDSPEAELGGYVTQRVREQAQEFGISEVATTEIGKKAAAFTQAVLARPFTVVTRGENALGASKLPREYAFIKTASGEDLGSMLLERGLGRSHGKSVATPWMSASQLWKKYDGLQAQAKRQGLGAWGVEASQPTLNLSSYWDKSQN